MLDFLAPVFSAIKSFFMFFKPVLDFIISTKVPEQLETIDYKGLFSNGWFLVPYIAMIGWNIYKQAITTIILILLFTGSWAFFGTPLMQDIVGQDEMRLDTVLPLVAGACVVLGIAIYVFLFKSD